MGSLAVGVSCQAWMRGVASMVTGEEAVALLITFVDGLWFVEAALVHADVSDTPFDEVYGVYQIASFSIMR